MRIKKGVSTLGLKPEIVCIFPVIESIFQSCAGKEAVLTCGTDGKHHKYSRHYVGLATDWRIRHIKGYAQIVRDELKAALPDSYYVLLHKTHIHISFKPTR